ELVEEHVVVEHVHSARRVDHELCVGTGSVDVDRRLGPDSLVGDTVAVVVGPVRANLGRGHDLPGACSPAEAVRIADACARMTKTHVLGHRRTCVAAPYLAR